MLGEKHDLLHEFPEYREQIHALKTGNAHFARLFEEYHAVDHEIRRIEEGVETPSDDYLEERKKLRLNLKDQLFEMLQQA
ncbi:MAG: YdcH family protein [Gammaproteobacteria bacterium]